MADRALGTGGATTPVVGSRRTAGYWLVIAGAIGFTISVFLPMIDWGGPDGTRISLFTHQVMADVWPLSIRLFHVLWLLVGVLTLAVTAAAGLRKHDWGRPALIGAGIIWLVYWGGFLISYPTILGMGEQHVVFGYWFLAASIGLVALGTFLASLPGPQVETVS